MRLAIIFFSLSVMHLAASASDYLYKLDSLETALEEAKGLKKAGILYELANHTAPWDSTQCKKYIEQQKELLVASKNPLLMGNLDQNLGDYHYYRDEYSDAIEYYNRSIDEFIEAKAYTRAGLSYFKVIVILNNTGNTGKAMMYLQLMLEMMEKGVDRFWLTGGYYALGFFNNNVIGDYEASKKHLRKAIQLAEEINISSTIMGGLYASYALACFRLGQHDSTFLINRRALDLFDEDRLDGMVMKTQVLHETGTYHYSIKEYDSAVRYFTEAQNRAKEMTSLIMLNRNSLYSGRVYYKLGDLDRAERYLNNSIHYGLMSDSLKQAFLKPEYRQVPYHAWDIMMKTMTPRMTAQQTNYYLRSAYGLLSSIYEEKGDFERSRVFLKKKYQADLVSRKLEESKALLGIQLTYESDKKDRQILLLSQQNELSEFRVRQSNYFLYGLIGLVIIISVLAYLFIRQNKLKTEQRNTVLEQKLLRTQMNPHFIFNALSNISNLIDKNDNETASAYLTKFAMLVRHILESTRSDFIELDEEIINLENYLSLQKLRFDKKFNYKIEVDKDIDAKEVSIPSMLIQPFVENSIEHGIKPKETIGHIQVRLMKQNGFLNCEISDDGIGRKKSMELRPKTHRSLATSITRERLDALNRKLKKKVALEITDLESELGIPLGTRVNILLPTTL